MQLALVSVAHFRSHFLAFPNCFIRLGATVGAGIVQQLIMEDMEGFLASKKSA
jgi:hypothetical protein